MSRVANPTPQRQPERWVSLPAVLWVLDDAPDVPASLVSLLVGFARHADAEGRNSYPSVETLMRYTRKSERQVRDDIKALRKLGLLVVADDQSPAQHIRADRRPTVYHLPIASRRADDTTGCGVPHVVDDAPTDERGAADRTSQPSRGAVQRSTGCDTASNGVRWTAPEEDMNKTYKKASSSPSSSSSSSTKPRDDDDDDTRTKKIETRKRKERASAKRKIMHRVGADDQQAEMLLDYLIEQYNAGNLDRYVDGLDDEDLATRLEDATWELETEREAEADRVRQADGVIGQVAKRYPDADLDVLRAAYIAALRQGHTGEAICAAMNATVDWPGQGDPIDDYLAAIEALGYPVAA